MSTVYGPFYYKDPNIDRAVVTFDLSEFPACCGAVIVSNLRTMVLDEAGRLTFRPLGDHDQILRTLMQSFAANLSKVGNHSNFYVKHPDTQERSRILQWWPVSKNVDDYNWYYSLSESQQKHLNNASLFKYFSRVGTYFFSGIDERGRECKEYKTGRSAYELSLLMGCEEVSRSKNPRTGNVIVITRLVDKGVRV